MGGTTGRHIRNEAAGGARRGRRLWLWLLVVVLMLGAATGVFLLVMDSRSVAFKSISPPADSVSSARPLAITCELDRFVPGRGSISLTVDGREVPAADLSLEEGLVRARLALPDGAHTVVLAYDSSNPFARHLERSWSFTVDTAAPTVSVKSPAEFPLLLARSSDVSFVLSEPATVFLTLEGAGVPVDSPAAGTSAGGAATVKARLVADEGLHTLSLTATDRAGNSVTQEWDLIVDYRAPTLSAGGLPDAEIWTDRNSAAVALTVSDHFADRLEVTATLDGASLSLERQAGSKAGERMFGFETGVLAEGTHVITLSAKDPGGHVTVLEREFLVDTSSVFGECSLKSGAQGNDVKQLQRILKIKGVYSYAGDPSGILDEETAAAVAVFNEQNGLPGGRVVSAQTLKYLLGYVRIDLSDRTLHVHGGDDSLLKTYRIAVGMSAYPTPTGDFRIINKAKDPTWNPPDSAWAAGMGPVPPGPGNPLGTRWMGLNSPGIGIHGTPSPSTIGTAASHGCIRMKIPEAEDLFDRVFVGTPVEIVK